MLLFTVRGSVGEFCIFNIVLLCGRNGCGEHWQVTCFGLSTYSYSAFQFTLDAMLLVSGGDLTENSCL